MDASARGVWKESALDTLAALLDSPLALKVNVGVGVALFVAFLVYWFSREGRDERGRRYRVEPGAENGVTLLFAVGKTPESVDGVEPFYSNEWK